MTRENYRGTKVWWFLPNSHGERYNRKGPRLFRRRRRCPISAISQGWNDGTNSSFPVLKLPSYTSSSLHPARRSSWSNTHSKTTQGTIFWPRMYADVHSTVIECTRCAYNWAGQKMARPLQVVPTTKYLESVSADILCYIPKRDSAYVLILVISYRFSNLTQVVTMWCITEYNVAVTFTENWILKNGSPETLLTNNGPQFSARLFRSVYQILGVMDLYTPK